MTFSLYELNALLSALLSVAAIFIVLLARTIRTLKNERDFAREKNEADSKILFLKSRYASMGETVGNIAHQWKQPLNAIGSIQNSIKASLIFQGEISKEKLLDSVDKSFKLLQHLGETIDTFYSFLSQRNNEEMSFAVADELEAIRKITEYSFENSRIRLNFILDANPMIQGNPNEFTHALLNLILNAKDAFDGCESDSPTITVHVRDGNDICTITISDNAGGIRVEPIDMVFDLHISTKEEGSGLGLFMTKNIIEKRFGGTIGVENKNGGACFTITLPYAEYGEYFSPEAAPDEKLTLARINQLTHKIIELEELEKTLRKWADIFKQAHWAIAMHVGKSNTFELTNAAFHTLYGYTAQELKNLSVPDLFTPESLPILHKVQQEAFEKGYVAFESLHKRRDGSTFPVSVELIVVKNDEGEILYHIANIWDLTEKKASEERLMLKKFALDHIKDSVFMIDENARFHYVNEGACTALGYTREELERLSVGDVDPDWPSERWPEHWDVLKKAGSMTMELRHKRRDGTTFPVEVSANYIEFGDKHYNMAIARDITRRKAAEENLLLKKFALDTINEAVFLIDKNSMFHYVNEGACTALGYTKDELISMGVTDLDPNFPIEQWNIHWEEIKEQKTTLTLTQHRRKDGSIFPIEISSNYFAYNGVEYSLAVSRDITERLQLEEQKDNERMKLFFERQLVGMAITSPEKGWLHTNEKLRQMLGYTHEELTQLTWAEMTYPEDLAPDVEQFEKLLSGEIEDYMLEKRFIRKDGTIVYTNLAVSCVRNDNRSVNYVLALLEDITERKELEALLEKERKFLIDAQRVAHTGSWYLDIPNRVLSWSDETYRIFELEKEEIDDLHKTFYACVHPEDRERVEAPYVESLKTRLPYQVEHRIVMKNGRIKYVIESCEHIYDNDGTPLYSIGTVQDITERKKAEDELQSNRNLLHAILESSPGVITFALDTHYRYIAFDSKHAEVMRTIFGQEIALGMNMLEAVIAHADREIAKRSFDRALRGESFIAEEEYGDKRLSRNYWQIFYAPIYSENGEIMGLTCFNMDITERKAAEEAVKNLNTTLEKRVLERTTQLQEAVATMHKEIMERIEAEKQLKLVETAVNSSTEAIYINDNDLSIIYVNDGACRMLGYTREELLGMKIADIDANFTTKQIFEIRDNTVGNKQTFFETKHRTKEGKIIDVEIVGNPFVYEGIEAVISVVKDITDKKSVDKRLRLVETAMNHASEAIYIVGDDRSILYVSEGACRMLGYGREELMKMKVYEIDAAMSKEDIDAVKEYVAGTNDITFETKHRAKDGHIMDVEITVTAFIYEDVTLRLSIVQEISERKKIEALQQERLALEERLSKIAAAAPGVNYIFEKSSDGIFRFTYVAPGFEELFGFSVDVAMDDFNIVMEHVHPNDQEAMRKSILVTARDLTKWHEEFRILHPQKGVIWIEGQSSPESQSDGSILWYGFFHDATVRKDAEAALARSEETFRAMVENSPDVIIRYDLECRRTYINPMGQFLMDKPLNEILGKTPSEYSPLPDSAAFESLFHRVVSEGKEIALESPYRTPEGEVRWGSQRIVPEFDIEGNVSSVMVIGRDMTERKKLEEKMRIREQYQRTLLDNFPYFVWLKDKESRLLAANLQYARVAKVESTSDLVGKSDFDFFPNELAQKYVIDDQAVMREGLPKNVEEPYADEHGEIHWMETWKSPVWVDGIIVGTVGCSRDITEQKKAEAAIKVSEQRYREIFENSSDLIYLVEVVDVDHYRYLAVNRAFEKVTGISRDLLIGELIGKNTTSETARTMKDQYRRCVNTAEKIESVSVLDIPSGRKTFSYTLIPVLDEEEKVCRIVALAKEVTNKG